VGKDTQKLSVFLPETAQGEGKRRNSNHPREYPYGEIKTVSERPAAALGSGRRGDNTLSESKHKK